MPERPTPSFPLQEYLGFTIERRPDRVTASLQLDERHMNPNGWSHGAVAFTMMDTAMGAAVMSMLDEGCFCATIEMQTRFHRSAKGGRLTAEVTILQAGRRIIHLEGRTVDDEGRLIATATSSFAVIRPSDRAGES